jgi:hypothetical protein
VRERVSVPVLVSVLVLVLALVHSVVPEQVLVSVVKSTAVQVSALGAASTSALVLVRELVLVPV